MTQLGGQGSSYLWPQQLLSMRLTPKLNQPASLLRTDTGCWEKEGRAPHLGLGALAIMKSTAVAAAV